MAVLRGIMRPTSLGKTWAIAREADGNLYVYGANHFKVDESLTEDQRKRIRQLTYEGISARLARAEVLGEEVF